MSYLPLLHDILNSTNPFNWRLRQSLALQLSDLVMLPPPHLLFNTLFILVMTLLQDPVASVRVDTFAGVAKLICVLNSLPDTPTNESESTQSSPTADKFVKAVADAINELVRGDTYQQRQLWLELTRQLLCDLPRDIFETYFIEGILVLTTDSVSNVRVNVADLLAGWAPEYVNPWEEREENKPNHPWVWLLNRDDIQECVRRLSKDDNDVYLKIKLLSPMFPSITFSSMSCRGMKEAPGGTKMILMNDRDNQDTEHKTDEAVDDAEIVEEVDIEVKAASLVITDDLEERGEEVKVDEIDVNSQGNLDVQRLEIATAGLSIDPSEEEDTHTENNDCPTGASMDEYGKDSPEDTENQ